MLIPIHRCCKSSIILISLNRNCISSIPHPLKQSPNLPSSMFFRLPANDRIQMAKENDIAVTAYSSFGPLSFRELDWKKAHDTQLLFEADPVVAASKKHGKTPAQILLRWATQRGVCV